MKSENSSKQDVFVVESLRERRYMNHTYYYRVRWRGYTKADDTWEPEKNILDADLINKFEQMANEKLEQKKQRQLQQQQTANKSTTKRKFVRMIEDDDSEEEEEHVAKRRKVVEDDETNQKVSTVVEKQTQQRTKNSTRKRVEPARKPPSISVYSNPCVTRVKSELMFKHQQQTTTADISLSDLPKIPKKSHEKILEDVVDLNHIDDDEIEVIDLNL
jgi:hypothetical protein